jgi:fructose/tagatose bisphosphate aldolase
VLISYFQAISYGVVKVNLDTDMQFAYLSGVRDYGTCSLLQPRELTLIFSLYLTVLNKKGYLMTQGKRYVELYSLDHH